MSPHWRRAEILLEQTKAAAAQGLSSVSDQHGVEEVIDLAGSWASMKIIGWSWLAGRLLGSSRA
jgi:hypothetical protein